MFPGLYVFLRFSEVSDGTAVGYYHPSLYLALPSLRVLSDGTGVAVGIFDVLSCRS